MCLLAAATRMCLLAAADVSLRVCVCVCGVALLLLLLLLLLQLLPLHICPSNSAAGFAGDSGGDIYTDLFAAVERLPDNHLKTLNLAREWLCSLLPHVLQKTNRVK